MSSRKKHLMWCNNVGQTKLKKLFFGKKANLGKFTKFLNLYLDELVCMHLTSISILHEFFEPIILSFLLYFLQV